MDLVTNRVESNTFNVNLLTFYHFEMLLLEKTKLSQIRWYIYYNVLVLLMEMVAKYFVNLIIQFLSSPQEGSKEGSNLCLVGIYVYYTT